MGLYRYGPEPSVRMGLLWTAGLIGESAVLEFGSMGHMLYADKWLEQTGVANRSRLFTTHIDEKDIAMGITKRLEKALEELGKNKEIKAVFVLPSTIPETTGTDIQVICQDLAPQYEPMKIITFQTGGFKQKFHKGMEEALYQIAKEIPQQSAHAGNSKCLKYNIIGSCADLARFQPDALEIERMLRGAFHMEAICVLPSGASISDIERMGEADLNIVLRREGEKAAKELERRFGTPYVQGRPYGYRGTVSWLDRIAECIQQSWEKEFVEQEVEEGKSVTGYLEQVIPFYRGKARLYIGGNDEAVAGILDFACEELGMEKALAWCSNQEADQEAIPYLDEAALIKQITPDLGGILMADRRVARMAGRSNHMPINRGINAWSFNIYDSPYMGFRGALHLCSFWLEHMLED